MAFTVGLFVRMQQNFSTLSYHLHIILLILLLLQDHWSVSAARNRFSFVFQTTPNLITFFVHREDYLIYFMLLHLSWYKIIDNYNTFPGGPVLKPHYSWSDSPNEFIEWVWLHNVVHCSHLLDRLLLCSPFILFTRTLLSLAMSPIV